MAAELERRWEQALQALRQGEAEAANGAGTTPEPLTAELRRQWEEAHPTLRQLWDEGKLTNVRKKELLRVLIDKVVLQRPATDRCEVRIIWKGGDWTTAELPLPVVKYAEMSNCESLVSEVLRRARAGQSDKQIAAELTAAGYHAAPEAMPKRSFDRAHSAATWRLQPQDGVLSPRAGGVDHSGSSGPTTRGTQSVGILLDPREAITRSNETRRSGCTWSETTRESSRQLKELLRGERFSLTLKRRLS